ncbi:MAG: GC-type dockerin domain-anchored protein [Planctomycetota bacterium]
MNRIAAAVTLAAFASPALAQNLAISFQPTGEPNTYDMVAEAFAPFPPPHMDGFSLADVFCVWADTQVRLVGDAPITVLEWNTGYDLVIGGPEIVGSGTGTVEFKGAQTNYFGTPDSSNPMVAFRFRYDGTPAAFAAEMIGQNSIAFATAPHLSVYVFTSPYPDRPIYLTHSFGPLPGVECVADINGDGALSPGDFNTWVIAFNNQSAGCDQNGDGLCTPGDFNAWVINYNAGC